MRRPGVDQIWLGLWISKVVSLPTLGLVPFGSILSWGSTSGLVETPGCCVLGSFTLLSWHLPGQHGLVIRRGVQVLNIVPSMEVGPGRQGPHVRQDMVDAHERATQARKTLCTSSRTLLEKESLTSRCPLDPSLTPGGRPSSRWSSR